MLLKKFSQISPSIGLRSTEEGNVQFTAIQQPAYDVNRNSQVADEMFMLILMKVPKKDQNERESGTSSTGINTSMCHGIGESVECV